MSGFNFETMTVNRFSLFNGMVNVGDSINKEDLGVEMRGDTANYHSSDISDIYMEIRNKKRDFRRVVFIDDVYVKEEGIDSVGFEEDKIFVYILEYENMKESDKSRIVSELESSGFEDCTRWTYRDKDSMYLIKK